MILNINIPTKGRPEKLTRCLKSIDYSGEHNIFLSCYDAKEDLPLPIDSEDWPENVRIFEDKTKLTIETHNHICKFKGHFLGLSDDIVFHPEALDKAVEMLETELCSDGIVDFNVANMDAPDGCYMMLGNKFIDKFQNRTPYFPGYRFMFASAELRDFAKSIDKFKKGWEICLNHFHPSVTGKPDATHTRIRMKGIIEDDRRIYTERKKSGMLWTHM